MMSSDYTASDRVEHALVAADGFLLAGALWLALNVLIEVIAQPLFGPTGPGEMAPWLEATLWLAANILPIAAGAVAAWMLHGRRLSWIAAAGMLAGLMAGWAVGFVGFVGLFRVFRLAESSLGAPTGGPPWGFVIVLGVLMAALMLGPLVESAADLRHERRRHLILDGVRFVAVGVTTLLALWIAPLMGQLYGSEIAEAGAFMLPVAFSGGLAVIGADALTAIVHRARAHGTTGTPASMV